MNSLVRRHFGRRAAGYEAQALLQRAVACRLGRLCRDLPLPAGPRADLGAGSGLLSRALPALGLLQLDLCPELLQRNPQQPHLVWDLNDGLPSALQGAALLASGFALQWLDDPAGQLGHWCRALAPGGWLALAVPTAGSFPQWHRAAAAAGVACTALELPAADRLLHAASAAGLHPRHSRVLRFSRPHQGGLAVLRHLRRLGADASRRPPLTAGELRRLLAHWPQQTPLTWEVLLLVGQREHTKAPAP
ncbi:MULTISPECIES: methyltransferase domain-containing protein [unclassified Cyanobium]|uniref:methyltransferase domain-containing protein n=1 Tax=unclassified Cyanobium TaxID=2627006 RepID=UPI0020CC6C9A|nr:MULTISPECIES: methyltransferase domain-containing protein [unclassified Cyanobium]MCP9860496.1 methyltransferase domain-containing protein [Cyanobium sp. Cruz-8H5]MCP9867787.1 methyltransferase domain-containing protein [Cyanobium sp. Cruz-8D1]